MSDSLPPHELQHTRLFCPSPVPELAQSDVHQVGDAIQPFHPLLSPSPPTFNFSQHQGLFQWVGSSHQVAKVLEFQLISFRIDWFDFLAVQGTLKSILQHHSSKASILWCSAFLMIQPNSYIHKWLLENNRIQMQNENWNFPVLRPFLSFPNFLAYWVNYFKNIIF